MRVDLVIKDLVHTVRQILLALDNRLTATENFAPEGTRGQVLTSNGPNEPPSYQPVSAATGGEESAEPTTDAGDLISGTLAEARLQGAYRGITELWPLRVRVGSLAYQNPLATTGEVPADHDMVVVGPYAIDGTLTIDGRLVVLS